MRPPSLLPLLGFIGLSCALSTTVDNEPVKNANHIFNVIQDSMRQWGSSLHHNGVSFFLAGVPTGTQFYHGTSKASPVNGTEWLAFEPEHAMVFARPRRGPPPHLPPDDPNTERHARGHGELRKRDHYNKDEKHHGPPGGRAPKESDENEAGYLHTYAAAKDLRLLYLDGMSAAKTSKGTLDSQDAVLFAGSLDDHPSPGGQENERARLACEMAQSEWEGRIDGVLRMEAGFEIILCDFERDLIPVRITQVKRSSEEHRDDGNIHGPGGPGGPGAPPHGGPGNGPDASRWMRAITARYNGIGGNRVSLNFNHFVTAFSHDVELFRDNSTFPRFVGLSAEERAAIRAEVTDLVMTYHPAEVGEDWQAITDMIVIRYSKELSYFVSDSIDSIERLQSEIERVLSPFIDYSERDDVAEIERCATQFLPSTSFESGGIAARAVYGVTHRICSSLVEAGKGRDLMSAIRVIRDLVGYLDWATWKECRGCAANEICVVPIWPMGTVQDYDSPQCKDASNPYDQGGESYWGGMRN
ncbi:Pc20g04960 [Penicillium rubens Wisconsin 54-1255]|uniref:Pc20g04960 protein n=1 Tax=Penicillium rubens (strain ATCC 28089 / DSM 1075 / NRRL 1951 / Wisconsin 54-1255) TaxID=500485 RepID=B6HEC0_PENRW|nr:Pc20g04960 [Penicillium rubens Wisconsin 54-1255]